MIDPKECTHPEQAGTEYRRGDRTPEGKAAGAKCIVYRCGMCGAQLRKVMPPTWDGTLALWGGATVLV